MRYVIETTIESLLHDVPARAHRYLLVLLAAGAGGLLTFCSPTLTYYSPGPTSAPPAKNCFNDNCPADAVPVLLGGNDYSPPTIPNIVRWQKAGQFAGQTFQIIQGSYRDKGYDWFEDDIPCNCLCRGSVHVALGGRCLEPPLPDTPEWEAVLRGR